MFYAYGTDADSKTTRLAHWEQVKKSSGIIPEGLRNKPTLPRALSYIWECYADISKGCERVTYQELKAYCDLTGEQLTPWESTLIVEIDELRRINGH